MRVAWSCNPKETMSRTHDLVVLYDESAWSAQEDCDCACPSRPPLPLPPADRPLALFRHPALRELPLDDQHAVVFVPSQSRVAVLNHAARALIDSFAAP